MANVLKKNDLYIFDLSKPLLNSLDLMSFDYSLREIEIDTGSHRNEEKTTEDVQSLQQKSPSNSMRCTVCQVDFESRDVQKAHYQTDYHLMNVKRSLRGLNVLSLSEFNEVVSKELDNKSKDENTENEQSSSGEADESEGVSDQESDASVNDYMESIIEDDMKKLSLREDESSVVSHLNTQSPYIFFKSSTLPKNEVLGIYKSVFSKASLSKPYEALDSWNSQESSSMAISALFMVGGGHFAGAIVSHHRLNVKGNAHKKNETLIEQAVNLLEHKTFHRYTTRRKQGGSQSAMDNAKGKANSAGSALRRYNETALRTDIQGVLKDWEPYLSKCENIFIRARNVSDRKIFTDNTILNKDDDRIKSFPFTTSRPTVLELKKAWCELCYLKILPRPEPLTIKQTVQKPETLSKKDGAEEKQELSTEEKQTEEVVSLIKKGRAPLLIVFLKKNKLDGRFQLKPETKYSLTPTMLHYASQQGMKQMVIVLLSNLKCDPTIKNRLGRTPWDLTKDDGVRHAFQIARHTLGESFTNWDESHIGEPLSREQVNELNELKQSTENERTKNMIKVELEAAKERQRSAKDTERGPGKKLTSIPSVHQQNLNSLTDEQRRRLMREQRARAAEERMNRSLDK
ncbi:Vms1p [Saccharomyces eubayanus]|uniref:Vms1p n=1 Tax=Saccharomyces eubayanus TaxID=1080349 RepID=UPI0006C16789|nr:VMS1-like protein [Saccharomyces eubayanus]KOH00903.1 VMS1-like protein [Saccharomyces eubayanus]